MEKDSQVLISFFVVNYNGGQLIRACLNSIEAFAGVTNYEVIVVDNHSSDRSADLLEKEFPKIRLIRNDRNLGFSRAMNQAFKASKGKYMFSFNPDAELQPGCIPSIINYMEHNPTVGKVGTSAIESNGEVTLPTIQFPKWITPQTVKVFRSKFSPSSTSDSIDEKKINLNDVSWLFGTGILVRRESLGSAEFLYPERSFLFWEEYWLSKTIKGNGYRIAVLPQAQIIHHSSTTFKTNKSKLKMARLLSLSHEYNVRVIEYGKMNALLNMFLFSLDYSFLWILFSPKLLFNKKDLDLYNTIIDYYAKSRAGFIILFSSESSINKIDKKAEEFFNKKIS